jgi:hypothetical protein
MSPRKRKETTVEFIIFLLVIILLNIASQLWGVDSRDGINSREWELRQLWYGFH